MIGTEIDGRYRVEAALGEGGAGTVYRATHVGLGRQVAVKVLRAEYGASPELRRRFEREARALAVLSHPNVVGVLDSGVAGDTPYLVMDFLEGESLADRLRRGPLPLDDAMKVLRELLAALAFVHERGLVHRDVKPANVFLAKTETGEIVRLLDFGLAKFVAPEVNERALTRAGQVFGTPAYMAPEQVAGQEADARADVYAAGIVLFEMLSGRAPFHGDSSEVLRQHVMEDLPLEALPSTVPRAVVEVMKKAAGKTRAERYANGAEMLAALEAAAGGRPHAPSGGGEEAPAPPWKRVLSRLGYAFAIVTSLSALVLAATAVYVLADPERTREWHAVQRFLGVRPAPSSARIVGATPSASASAAAAPVPSTSFKTPEAAAAPPPPASAAEPAPAPPPRGPAPDPWASTPPELSRFVAKVNKGRVLDRREIILVHQYNGKHPNDPRGHVVLARSYLRRKWLKDSSSEYGIAYKIDPNVRGDARMLKDLLSLVELAWAEGARLVVEAYGADARPGIEQELARKTLKPDQRARLEKLVTELASP